MTRRVQQAIDGLPSQCKLIFQLVREHDLKYKEVARHPQHLGPHRPQPTRHRRQKDRLRRPTRHPHPPTKTKIHLTPLHPPPPTPPIKFFPTTGTSPIFRVLFTMDHEKIWHLLIGKLSGEATAEELAQLDQLLQQHPHIAAQAASVEALWKAKGSAGQESTDLLFNKHLQRLSDDTVQNTPFYHRPEKNAARPL
ncbi:hypothetical protein ACQ86N_29080 [Puia sp. P3]|uniref:hypothetical protein n=1 Tax=Puia sp. P3 TaxID=3423952 RepID=UPI003D666B13